MDRLPLARIALVAAALVVVGVVENTLFGSDHGGAKHDVSVAFFLVALAAIVTLVVVGVAALVRRVRATA